MINTKKEDRNVKSFLKGFITGFGGGGMMYLGKKTNFMVVNRQKLGYAWLSRTIFSAGNSIVENAASYQKWWSRWHYDLGFVRLEYNVPGKTLRPRIMISSFGSFLLNIYLGRIDARVSMASGTVTFRTNKIRYAPYLVGSTTGNFFVLNDTIKNNLLFYEIFAHESVHVFQFQELSGVNYIFTPLTSKWRKSSPVFATLNKWFYGDLNYQAMLGNYFFVQGGVKRSLYCKNFLENEAEVLPTGRISCP